VEKTKDGYLKMLIRYIMQGEEHSDKTLNDVMKVIGSIKQIADIFKISKMSVTVQKKEN
jgi:hypothetical protein